MFGWWFEFAGACGHQQPAVTEEFGKHTGTTVIPCGRAFRSVPTANKTEFGSGPESFACFRRHFQEKAACGGGNGKGRIRTCQLAEDFAASFKIKSLKGFVREREGQKPDHFVSPFESRAGNFQVSNGGWIPGSGKKREALGCRSGAVEKIEGQYPQL